MTMSYTVTFVFVVLCLSRLEAYKYFQDKFPNGERIPHPCKPNFLWQGVGHQNVDGGGKRNPFGLDFKANNFKWDRCLCEHDSDGDGKTNGEELGDPNCSWTEGSVPERLDGLSHPGVCEPLDSAECIGRNNWEFCDYEEFTCDAINGPDVEAIEIRFPDTTVPARETTYWCMTFDLDLDVNTDYHLIATKPLIDNHYVMHHISLFGCEPTEGDDNSWKLTSPTECGMAMSRCRTGFGGWTLGLQGECLPDEYGFWMGRNGIRTVLMQFHWNNPQEKPDYVDGSGMMLYATPHLRDNDAGFVTLGTTALSIPPGRQEYTQESYCHSQCSSRLNHTLYFSEILLHMHYLGHSAAVEHIRNGEILDIIFDADYNYDNPKPKRYEEPIVFQPGDELKLTCNFRSTSRSGITYYGDATSDEMCFAFITYYPAREYDIGVCMTYKSLDVCESAYEFDVSPLGQCNHTAFFNQTTIYNMFGAVDYACNSTTKCPAGCQQAIDFVKQDPCLVGDIGDFTQYQLIALYYGEYGRNWVALLHSCEDDWDRTILFREPNRTNNRDTDDDDSSEGRDPRDDGRCVFDIDRGNGAVSAVSRVWMVVLIGIVTAAVVL